MLTKVTYSMISHAPVNVRDFGATGDGVTDDTTTIQAAIDSLGAGGGKVVVPPGTYMINPVVNPTSDTFGGIKLRNNVWLEIQAGAKLQAIPVTQSFNCVVQAYRISNAKISGAGTIQGEKTGHLGSTGEHGMGVAILGSTDIEVSGLEIYDCWGDCIYSGYSNVAGVYTASRLIKIFGNTLHDARRQGISVVYTDGFQICENTIYNIGGTAPEAAIDLEPDDPARQNSGGVIADNIGYACGQGLTLYVQNTNIVVTGNDFKSTGPALRIVDGAVNVRITGNRFESTAAGSEACFWADGTGFVDMSTVDITNNTFVNGGTGGCIAVRPSVNYLNVKYNKVSVTITQVGALSIEGDANIEYNDVVASAAAFSGVIKAFVYATDGAFGGNTFTNLTAETPTFQYIGTSRLVTADYETGIWTPTLLASGTNFSAVSYDASTGGRYSKIGNVVQIQLQLRTTAVTVGPASGNIRIGGLPFPAVANTGSTADGSGTFAVGNVANWASTHPSAAVILGGEQQIRLLGRATANGATSDVVVADVSTGAGGNIIYLAGTYITSDF
jgi:hypothetical protein